MNKSVIREMLHPMSHLGTDGNLMGKQTQKKSGDGKDLCKFKDSRNAEIFTGYISYFSVSKNKQ